MWLMLVLIVISLLSVGSEASACPKSMTVENVRVAAIDRAFFLPWGTPDGGVSNRAQFVGNL